MVKIGSRSGFLTTIKETHLESSAAESMISFLYVLKGFKCLHFLSTSFLARSVTLWKKPYPVPLFFR